MLSVVVFNIIHVPCSKLIYDIYSNNCTTIKDNKRKIVYIWHSSHMFWPTLAISGRWLTREHIVIAIYITVVRYKTKIHVLSKWHDEIFTPWSRLRKFIFVMILFIVRLQMDICVKRIHVVIQDFSSEYLNYR